MLMLRCGFCISYVLYFYYHYFYLFLVKRFFLHIARSTFVGVLIGLLWGQSRMIYIWINNIYTCHVADIYKSPCKYTVCVFVCFFFSSLWYFVVGDCGDCGGGGVQLLCKGKYQSQTFIIHCMHIIRLFILICHAFEDFFLFLFSFSFSCFLWSMLNGISAFVFRTMFIMYVIWFTNVPIINRKENDKRDKSIKN